VLLHYLVNINIRKLAKIWSTHYYQQ